jgi:acyl-CoA thioester hydrolase
MTMMHPWLTSLIGENLLQECRRADDLLVTARVRVAFISGGKAQRIPKALRLAMEGHR